MSRWNVACHFRKRKLLIAINAVCSLSIFFFGYDQVGNQCGSGIQKVQTFWKATARGDKLTGREWYVRRSTLPTCGTYG